jgi:hypothetical protein
MYVVAKSYLAGNKDTDVLTIIFPKGTGHGCANRS